ncbi:MAG TPA: 30S ribosomal protein S2 [Candidatus Lokiarchaeia archaeon]|nr:30S ribosomal protein S2 [Candidatus Lokiarchaeia archaeon]
MAPIKEKEKPDEDQEEDEIEEVKHDIDAEEATPDELKKEGNENLLIDRNEYLAAGVHIGTKVKTIHTKPYIYRITSYGLYVINILKTDERIRVAGKFLSRFEPKKIMVCSVRRYGHKPVLKFCETIGALPQIGRFIPGTLTNYLLDNYKEVDVVIICDPHADKQALSECRIARIPVVSLVDTDDTLSGVDMGIPTNNRGRKALSLVFFLLARQILRERGDIPADGDIDFKIDDFESKIRPQIHQ